MKKAVSPCLLSEVDKGSQCPRSCWLGEAKTTVHFGDVDEMGASITPAFVEIIVLLETVSW